MYYKQTRMKKALSLGTFDGVHKGHRQVLDLPEGYKKTVVTFISPPKSALSGEKELIMTLKDKYRVLANLGVEEILALDFSEVKEMPAEEFLRFIYEEFNPALISCGFNYRFGKGALGDVKKISDFCRDKGIEFKEAKAVDVDGETVSSTLIRGYIKNGEVERANKLLTEPFSFETPVIKGDERGRTIGFPTANQRYPEELVKLKFGVYKTKVIIDGNEFEGITDIGIRPTFETDYVISETYIKDFKGDLYGKNIRIIPLKFLREEMKFSSIDELKRQIELDLRR